MTRDYLTAPHKTRHVPGWKTALPAKQSYNMQELPRLIDSMTSLNMFHASLLVVAEGGRYHCYGKASHLLSHTIAVQRKCHECNSGVDTDVTF